MKLRLGGLIFAWLAALGLVTWLVLTGREVALERGQRSAAALAAVVEQQAARTFQAVYLTLGAVGDAHQLSPRPKKNDPGFQQMMARRLKDIPFVRAIYIVANDGLIIHDTDYPKTPPVSLADRPYFRAYEAQPTRDETVWPPILSRSGTGWFLPVTRALGRGDEFEGVVVAAIQAAHFESQFEAVGLSDRDVIGLFHRDGTLAASYPRFAEGIGKNYKEFPLFARLEHEESGSFWTDRGLVPGNRMVSYRAVKGAPFVVSVSRGEADMLVEWRRTATASLVAMSALTIFLGWLIVRLVRDNARRALERERHTQADKMEALGQLSSGMAHDFANMLNVVRINVELLRRAAGDRTVTDHALGAIERAVQSGRQVTERLLSFARRRPLALARVRLDRWLEAARPLLEQAAGSRITLTVQTDQSALEVLCDSGELDIALVNLVVNARDAGSGRVDVRAFACDEQSGAPKAFVGKPARFVCLRVKDDGPGMTEEVRRRALEPFYTTKGEAGTGLGLWQVYRFMQQVGGQMTIESAPGHGTAVHLYFPVAPVGSDAQS